MTLRVRILLGYGFLLALLLVSAAGAALGFHQLGQAIGLLARDFESMQAATDMLGALERQDSLVLALMIGESEEEKGLELGQEDAKFAAALEDAHGATSSSEEKAIAAELGRLFGSYREERDQLLAAITLEERLGRYKAKTFPAFEKVREQISALIRLNQEAIEKVDKNAQKSARQRAIVHALLVTVALFALGFLSREMQRLVLDRLDELKSVAKAIASGQRRRRVSVVREDELGFVARQLNAALDAQEEVEAAMHGRLAHQRQLVLALLEARGRPSAVFSLPGDLVASTLEEKATAELGRALTAALERGALEIPKAGTKVRRKRFKLDAGEHRLGVRLLEAPEERLVGWLASFEPKDDGHDDDDDDNHSDDKHSERN